MYHIDEAQRAARAGMANKNIYAFKPDFRALLVVFF